MNIYEVCASSLFKEYQVCSEVQKNVGNTSMAEHSAVQFFLARTEALGLARAFLGVHSTQLTQQEATQVFKVWRAA